MNESTQKKSLRTSLDVVGSDFPGDDVVRAGDVFDALLTLQQLFTEFGKDAKNEFSNFKYVTLGKMINQVNPHLAELKCILVTTTEFVNNQIAVTSTLRHVPSRTEIPFTFTVPWADMKGQSNPQIAGSTISYGRRYNLVNLLNSSSSDNDAEDSYRRCLAMIDDAKTIGECKNCAEFSINAVKPYSLEAHKELHERITIRKESLKAQAEVAEIVQISQENCDDQ